MQWLTTGMSNLLDDKQSIHSSYTITQNWLKTASWHATPPLSIAYNYVSAFTATRQDLTHPVQFKFHLVWLQICVMPTGLSQLSGIEWGRVGWGGVEWVGLSGMELSKYSRVGLFWVRHGARRIFGEVVVIDIPLYWHNLLFTSTRKVWDRQIVEKRYHFPKIK